MSPEVASASVASVAPAAAVSFSEAFVAMQESGY